MRTCFGRPAGRAAILTDASTRSAWQTHWCRPSQGGSAASRTRAIHSPWDGCATPALGSPSCLFLSDPGRRAKLEERMAPGVRDVLLERLIDAEAQARENADGWPETWPEDHTEDDTKEVRSPVRPECA